MVVAVDTSGAEKALDAGGSVLDAVVVYAQGAVCTRRARVVVPGGHRGDLRVRIGDVPLSAVAQSLRGAVAAGPEGVRVADVRPHVEAVLVEPEDLPELRRALDAATERRSRLTGRRTRLAAEIEATAALRAVPGKPRREDPYPRPASVEPVLALADFVARRLTTLHDRMRALDGDCREADYDVAVAQHRLAEASGAVRTEETRTTGAAVVTLDGLPEDASDPVEIVLDLEYQVPGARWVPQYQLRLDRAMTGGTLVMRAAVAQRTGEDWSGVRLGLSTADLDRRTDLPELRSLRIGRRQAAPPASGWREPPSGLDELFTGYDAGESKRQQRLSSLGRPVPRAGGYGGPPDGLLVGGAPEPRYVDDEDTDSWMYAEQDRGMTFAGSPPRAPGAAAPPPMMAAPAAPAAQAMPA
ncbi:DUF4139 domain-containing protein, partial [Yinghuangia seranimata]|uniref:DUF4139 domain-containing protein n=1 Tax=Yinghuangia seranimata TaxID=408067 RepID=UPI00248B88E3